jgi:hypothetical protein
MLFGGNEENEGILFYPLTSLHIYGIIPLVVRE